MTPPAFVTTEQVGEFMSRNAWRYLEAIKILKGLVSDLRFTEEGRNAIYSIYSRGDRQRGGDEFKELWKVAEKVKKARLGMPEDNVPPNHDFSIQDVTDIIALTMVCVYPSDVNLVRDMIRSRLRRETRIIGKPKVKVERGYRALHLILGLMDKKYAGIICEVQVKTILHDAWSAKTHDLTYKPQGPLPDKIDVLMESMSNQLTELDRQSEVYKQEINKRWEWDVKRKEASRLSFAKMIGKHFPRERTRRPNYRMIYDDICNNENKYREGSVSKVLKKIENYSHYGYDLYLCRLVTLLAVIRSEDDLEETTFDYIDRCLQSAEPKELEAVMTFKGVAFFSFNKMNEALRCAEKGLELALQMKPRDTKGVTRCRVNIAHYLAEVGGDPESEEAERARALMNQIVRASGGIKNLSPGRLDTLGLVNIAFGRNRKEIEKGRSFCEQAYKKDSRNKVAKAFWDLHRSIADEKLSSLLH